MSDSDIAARLYASTTPSAHPAQPAAPPAATVPDAPVAEAVPPAELGAPAPKSLEEISRGLYGERKPADQADAAEPAQSREAVVKMRDTSERRLFSAEKTYESVPVELWLERAEGTPEQKAAFARELREVYADLSMTSQDALDLNAVVEQITEAITAETKAKWQADATRSVLQRYGPRAREQLQLARKLAQRDPAVLEYLEATGLVDHPAFVLKFIELAQRERAKNRL